MVLETKERITRSGGYTSIQTSACVLSGLIIRLSMIRPLFLSSLLTLLDALTLNEPHPYWSKIMPIISHNPCFLGSVCSGGRSTRMDSEKKGVHAAWLMEEKAIYIQSVVGHMMCYTSLWFHFRAGWSSHEGDGCGFTLSSRLTIMKGKQHHPVSITGLLLFEVATE